MDQTVIVPYLRVINFWEYWVKNWLDLWVNNVVRFLPMARPVKDDAEERFWAKVRKTRSCYWWIGATKCGYGIFWADGARIYAHRFSWKLHFGEIPEGMDVLHRCDQPLCVNPEHLFLGTQADNIRDMDSKGRANRPKGEAHGWAKLTNDQVLVIRKSPETHRELGKIYGVHHSVIGNIKRGKIWTHI